MKWNTMNIMEQKKTNVIMIIQTLLCLTDVNNAIRGLMMHLKMSKNADINLELILKYFSDQKFIDQKIYYSDYRHVADVSF